VVLAEKAKNEAKLKAHLKRVARIDPGLVHVRTSTPPAPLFLVQHRYGMRCCTTDLLPCFAHPRGLNSPASSSGTVKALLFAKASAWSCTGTCHMRLVRQRAVRDQHDG
jgi:hypothetical protein